MVNEDNLKRHLVPLNVAKVSLELHFRTIPCRVNWAGFGWVGSNCDHKAISVQLQLQLPAGTELGKIWSEKTMLKHIFGP